MNAEVKTEGGMRVFEDKRNNANILANYNDERAKISSPLIEFNHINVGGELVPEFELLEEIDRGEWGVVFRARDNANPGQVCAIKIPHRTNRAEDSLEYRVKDVETSSRKEGARFAQRYTVGMKLKRSETGEPFFEMEYFPSSLNKYLVEGKIWNPKDMRRVEIDKSYRKSYKKGDLKLEEIIELSGDIIQGLSEIHSRNNWDGNVHGDLKVNNILQDSKGRCFVGDFGNATAESANHSGPRDNCGHEYMRALSLFQEGSAPSMVRDVASFGIMLYRFFTGEYLFEKEIDELFEEGGMEAVQEYMRNYSESIDINNTKHSYVKEDNLEDILNNKLSGKLEWDAKKDVIPEPFKELIRECVMEKIYSGNSLYSRFNETVEKYREQEARRTLSKEYRKKLRNSIATTIGTTLAIGSLAVGSLWLFYLTSPNFENKMDFATQIKYSAEPEIDFKYEVEIDNAFEPDRNKIFNGLGDILTRDNGSDYYVRYPLQKESYISRLVDMYESTQFELEMNILPENFHHRLSILGYDPHVSSSESSRGIGSLLAYYLNKWHETRNENGAIDLENAVCDFFMGDFACVQARHYAKSSDFHDYVYAINPNTGMSVFSAGRKYQMLKFVHDFTQDPYFAQRVEIKWD